MFARALIVLLLTLNVGVAAWWALRPASPTPRPAREVLPVPPLQRVGEVLPPGAAAGHAAVTPANAARPASPTPPTASTTPAPVASTAVPAGALPDPGAVPLRDDSTLPVDTAAGEHCLRLGPYSTEAAVTQARARLPPQASRSRIEAVPGGKPGWRVWLPPLADHAAAQAMAERIAAAGFNDYYVVPDGGEAHSVALGRYGNAQAAQRRQAALQAAGFAARAEALGTSTYWLLVVAGRDFDAEAARIAVGAARRSDVACTALH
jgi:cell division protein FtsN